LLTASPVINTARVPPAAALAAIGIGADSFTAVHDPKRNDLRVGEVSEKGESQHAVDQDQDENEFEVPFDVLEFELPRREAGLDLGSGIPVRIQEDDLPTYSRWLQTPL
jgi:hypothetical protein